MVEDLKCIRAMRTKSLSLLFDALEETKLPQGFGAGMTVVQNNLRLFFAALFQADEMAKPVNSDN